MNRPSQGRKLKDLLARTGVVLPVLGTPDAGSAKITHNPLALASALKKLEEAAKQVPMQATPATAHMFIVNPLRGEGLANLFSTHPPMSKRIALLEKMDQEQKMAGMPKIIS